MAFVAISKGGASQIAWVFPFKLLLSVLLHMCDKANKCTSTYSYVSFLVLDAYKEMDFKKERFFS